MNTASSKKIAFPHRWPVYGLLNVVFDLYVVIAAGLGSNPDPRVLYVIILFAICSTPVLVLKRTNDRFTTYAAFLGIYFVSYGMIDVVTLTSPPSGGSAALDALTLPELLIILGGAAFSLGYRLRASRQQPSTFAVNDWPKRTLVGVGLLLWFAGTYATWYWNIDLTVRAGEFNNKSGIAITTILMMGRYAQPLGLLVIAYAYIVDRSAMLTLITVAVAVFQVYLGFVSDTKGGAMLGGLMVIVTGFFVTGRILKAWAVAGALFVFLAFPIFQAHRLYVVGERGASNANSVENFSKALQVSVDSQKRAAAEHAQSFFERSSVKSSVEMIVNKTGHGVPYQNGYTLIPLATSFIPRFIWPDKLDVQTGELVNTEFHVTGERVTYISPSCLGELYWNFGWIGGISGMFMLGMLLGWINGLCDLSVNVSVTRLLILGITMLQLGLRFEASIATEYSVWLRSIVGILFMHWLFARGRPAPASASGPETATLRGPMPVAFDKFPNLLR